MKMSKNLIEYKKRSIKSGKNVRISAGILYIVITTILVIVDSGKNLQIIPIMVLSYLMLLILINIRLHNEEKKLKWLIREHEAEMQKLKSKSNIK